MKLGLISSFLFVVSKHTHALRLSEDQYGIFEQLPEIPHPWVSKDSSNVNPDQPIKLHIHLKNLNMARFQQKVLDISTPNHPQYGQYMTREDVNNYLAPSSESSSLVQKWLEQSNAGKITKENDWFYVETTIEKAGQLLNTSYQAYQNVETGKHTIRTLSYSVPLSLHPHIDIIAPTIKFSSPSTHRSTLVDWPIEQTTSVQSLDHKIDGVSVACNTSITLDCLKDLYSLRDYDMPATTNNHFALAGFLEQYAQHDDLQQFLTHYEPSAVGSDFTTVLVNGGLNTQQNTTNKTLEMGEANLDIQYGFLAAQTPKIFISTGGRPPETTDIEVGNEPYLEFLTYLLSSAQIPQTISISYGDSEWTVPKSYAKTVCDLFSQLAARGVSVLVSSGDSGSGSNCTETTSGKLLYTPDFPASCPFVTSVGAVYHIDPEVAVEFSGGGFSDVFPRPAYQDAVIGSYLDKADPAFKSFFNNSGRAYPDVAAQGVNFHTIVRGADILVSGTSASTPIFAAMVALLNGMRIERGMSSLGLLNPWLYSGGYEAFKDITGGKSSGCVQVPGSGFSASEGWDPVTGFGTPNFAKMTELVGQYP